MGVGDAGDKSQVWYIAKEKANLSLFTDDMISYVENPKDSIPKLLELINEFSKIARYKINHCFPLKSV